MQAYVDRYWDNIITEKLTNIGAVLLKGAKACGKTRTAERVAKSKVDLLTDVQVVKRMEYQPGIVLEGDRPRLIDEWQEVPQVWNLVRKEVDSAQVPGQFILTGSTNPPESAKLHSGVGRFAVVEMGTMSWVEKGWSTAEVSLIDIMNPEPICSSAPEMDLDEVVEHLCIGGWPGLLGASTEKAFEFLTDYIKLTAEVDISRVSDKKRDPVKVRRLLSSIARNISTEASHVTLARDVRAGSDITEQTVAEYMEALTRLMIVQDLPSWRPHIRSTYQLRKTPKRHFVDSSLCIGALGLREADLLRDLEYLGLLFESCVIGNLRIYARQCGAELFYYRDSGGLEADAIIEFPDGRWIGVEVKLGASKADEAAANLLKLAKRIDPKRTGSPSALLVVTANGFAHKRKDGVCVVPLGVLGTGVQIRTASALSTSLIRLS
ncbi:MAG: ATP-binding protein [Coriobacteriales bacterium]|jgi:predicted AAA+ superfamily ATPase|nr:ATP-binding protein [Coriobacteriales bacterium]